MNEHLASRVRGSDFKFVQVPMCFFSMYLYFLSLSRQSLTSVKENIVKETWTYNNQYKSKIGNPCWASVVIDAHAFYLQEEAFTQQWYGNKLVL